MGAYPGFGIVLAISALSIRTAAQLAVPLLEAVPVAHTGVDFINRVTETEQRNILTTGMPYLYAGGGVALGDVNGDDLPDIFLVANESGSRLFLNRGDFRFEDVTAEYGIATGAWSTGALLADVNGDGWNDLYVLRAEQNDTLTGGNYLWINEGGKRFREAADEFGLAFRGRFVAASFLDYDGDGDADLYLVRYPDNSGVGNDLNFDFNRVYPDGLGTDLLLRNEGGSFTDVTEDMGILPENGFGISVLAADFTGDGWPDLYVGNDFAERDYFYVNLEGRGFREEFKERFAHSTFFTMGLDHGDVNGDQLDDLIALDMNPPELAKYKTDFTGFDFDIYAKARANFHSQEIRNALQLQQADGQFTDIAQIDRLAFTDWSWSPLFVDFDLDGRKDLHVTNGLKRDILNQSQFFNELDRELKAEGKSWDDVGDLELLRRVTPMPLANYCFRNLGHGRFADSTGYWTPGRPSISTGSAWADLDQDGDLDLVVNNIDTFPFLLRNHARERELGHYIALRPDFEGHTPYGMRATLFSGDWTATAELLNARGFQSSSEPILHFGLGDRQTIDSIRITLPGGRQSVLREPAINRTHGIALPTEQTLARKPDPRTLPFEELERWRPENETLNDFTVQSLLYRQVTPESPAIATGDIDGDGYDDVFRGRWNDSAAIFWLGGPAGSWRPLPLTGDPMPGGRLDGACSLSDLDGDGRPELLVAGLDYRRSLRRPVDTGYFGIYALRVGDASVELVSLAEHRLSQQPVVDFAVLPASGRKGKPGILLLEAPRLERPDLDFRLIRLADPLDRCLRDTLPTGRWGSLRASDLLLTDVQRNGSLDLIVSGDFGPVLLYAGDADGFGAPRPLHPGHGMWNGVVEVAGREGDPAYLMLSLGPNTRFNLRGEDSLVRLVGDFDRSGLINSIVCAARDGSWHPIYTYRDFTEAFPASRKRIYTYLDYAEATLDDIFDAPARPAARVDDMQTRWWNPVAQEAIELPPEFEWTSWNDALWLADSGWLVLAGNTASMRSELGLLDAAACLLVPVTWEGGRAILGPAQVWNEPGLVVGRVARLELGKETSVLLSTNRGLLMWRF